jgi:hypothetical protein
MQWETNTTMVKRTMVQISLGTSNLRCAEKQWRKKFKQETSAIRAMKVCGKAALESGVGIGA